MMTVSAHSGSAAISSRAEAFRLKRIFVSLDSIGFYPLRPQSKLKINEY